MEDDDDWYYPNAGKGIPEDQFQQDLEYIQNHPLFMKEVPQDLESHPELKALQNIMFDDTPENIAAHMNVKGNEYYKRMNEGKHFLKEAFRYYTEGIAQNCSNSETNAKLYSNRAAIHMVAKNYRKAIEDADEAIKHNPKMIKPYFRAASSFFELRRYKDAVKKCDAGLEVDPSCDELKQLRITALAEIDKIQKSNISEKYQKSKELDAVLDLCEKKKIVLGKPLYEIPNVDAKFHFDADGIFHVPIILAYPEFRQTDIIRDAKEDDPLEAHLATVLEYKLPWDIEGFYDMESIECFIELNQIEPYRVVQGSTKQKKGLKKIDISKTILQILQTKGFVLPQVIEVLIVSRRSKFYPLFLKNSGLVA